MDINISAMVGKNGSGKSTVTELLFMAINNINWKYTTQKKSYGRVTDIELELYHKIDALYRIHIKGTVIKIAEFKRTETGYSKPKNIPLSLFKLDQFFFTLAVNYSHSHSTRQTLVNGLTRFLRTSSVIKARS